MDELVWIRTHVRQLLQQLWAVDRVETDADGDVAFRCGTAACWVTVLDTDPVMVRVFAHAVHGIDGSESLLGELNAFQSRSLSARVEYDDDVVLVSQALSPIGLTAPVLDQALSAVGELADEVGGVLATVYGGATPYAPSYIVEEDAG